MLTLLCQHKKPSTTINPNSQQCSAHIFSFRKLKKSHFFLKLHEDKSNKYCQFLPSHSAAILNFAKNKWFASSHKYLIQSSPYVKRKHIWMQTHLSCGVPVILALVPGLVIVQLFCCTEVILLNCSALLRSQ